MENPDRHQREKLGLPTYDIPARISLIRKTHDPAYGELLGLPRGAIAIVRKAAERSGLQITFASRAVSNGVGLRDLSELKHLRLRPYQQDAIDRFMKRVQGYVCIPCGGGKTVLGAGAVYHSGQAAIVLVHTHELMDQWKSTFENLYGMKIKTAAPPYTALKPGEVVVGMVQKLARDGWKTHRMLSSAGAVLIDECHHTPAATYQNLMQAIPARLRWGLTATPERADGWTFLLPMVMGPELFRMTTPELIDGGFLVKPKILPIKTGQAVDITDERTGKPNMPQAVTRLCNTPERNALIVELALLGAQAGRTILILVPRVDYAHRLAQELKLEHVKAEAITGKVPKKYREKIMTKLRSGSLQVAVATQLADEGLDIPRLDMMLIASAGRAAGKAIQRIGRSMRPSEGKGTPIVVDLIDGGPFRSQWRARERAYLQDIGVDVPKPVSASDAVEVFKTLLKEGEQ
jgi:superfamily II DNA or RNA helicase